MSKICPNCQEVYDDSHGFCSNCGSRLIDNIDLNPALNIGDANAISGGVNINQSKNISSHDTHYHSTTIQERPKSESEIKLEATNQIRLKAEEIMVKHGRIDFSAMNQLRPLALQLGIADETFKSIIKDVRSNRNGSKSGLSAANARYLLQAQQAVQTNDMDVLYTLTPRLEAMASISQDDNVQYLYYLTLSLFNPIKSMEVYERQTDENYWRSFWAIISSIRMGKHAEATKILALFDPSRYEKSEEDQNILEAYFNIMKEDKDVAQEFLDEILGDPTDQVKPLLRAVESTLYEEEAENSEVRFFMERIMTKSDAVEKNQKSNGTTNTAEETNNKTKSINSKETEDLYAKACAASGPKRVLLLQKAADAGSLDAMYDLSDCYYDGDGVEKNVPMAVKWMLKAADLGSSEAQVQMGCVYNKGADGVEQSYTLAEKYLLMAAKSGNIDGQANLADLYLGLEDYEKSLVWARKAAQANNKLALFIMGLLYDEGLGVELNHVEALKWFERAAEAGDDLAQYIAGLFYDKGEFVEQDYVKAFNYYQMAAAQGNLKAIYELSGLYVSGLGTKADKNKAIELLHKAAEGGLQVAIDTLNEHPELMNDSEIQHSEIKESKAEVVDSTQTAELEEKTKPLSEEEAEQLYNESLNETGGQALIKLQDAADAEDEWALFFLAKYNKDREDEKDLSLAFTLFQKAADKGNVRAIVGLANCYYGGFGTKKDSKKAVELYKKAAEMGNSMALYNLGMYYYDEQDYKKAVELLNKASDLGCEFAYGILGACYYDGIGTNQDYTKAVDLFGKAVDLGDDIAMVSLGKCYSDGKGVEQDYGKAFDLYEKAADLGNSAAMDMIGTCHLKGLGTKKNKKEAFKWYCKGAEANYTHAMVNVGFCYDFGEGTKKDPAKALEWYQKALDNGFEMNDWISERIKSCKMSLSPVRPEVKISICNNPIFYFPSDSQEIVIPYKLLTVKNVENRTIKVVCTLKSNYGPTISNDQEWSFDKDGYFKGIKWRDVEGGVFFTIYSLELTNSGEYGYKGNFSAYDERNNLLSSCNFNITIKYKHKFFGDDEIKILKLQ